LVLAQRGGLLAAGAALFGLNKLMTRTPEPTETAG